MANLPPRADGMPDSSPGASYAHVLPTLSDGDRIGRRTTTAGPDNPVPTAKHVPHSLAVRLSLSDGLSDHVIDTGLRLDHGELAAIGGFNQLKSDLRRLIAAYKAESG